MNAVGIALMWCAMQVTLLGLAASGLYLLFRRLRPGAAGPIVLTGLMTVVILSFLALSPWPRWTIGRSRNSAQSAVTSAKISLTPRNDSALEKSPISPLPMGDGQGVRAAGPVAGNSVANSPLPTGEGQGVKAAGPAANLRLVPEKGMLFWQAIIEELSRAQSANPENTRHWPAAAAIILVSTVFCGLAWLVLGILAVRRQRLRAQPVVDGDLLELVDVLCAGLGCLRPVEIRQCGDLATAATVGWLRPVILLPPDWQTWTADQRKAILAHEIAHARGRDFPALLFGHFALVLHFYHPLVHWLMNRLRLEQELAADAAAAGVSGGQRQYLVTIAELALNQQDRPLFWPARSFLPTHNNFLRRIAVLRNNKLRFNRPSPVTRLMTIGIVLLCGLLVAGLRGPGGFAGARAEEPKQPEAAAGEDKAAKETKDESNKNFTARLPNGTTVELLGVGDYRKDGQWWDPAGKTIINPMPDGANEYSFKVAESGSVAREFVIRLGNSNLKTVGCRWGSFNFGVINKGNGVAGPDAEMQFVDCSVPDSLQTTTVRLGISSDAWTTLATNSSANDRRGGFHVLDNNRRIIFSDAYQKDGGIAVMVAHNVMGQEMRIVAIGNNDEEYYPDSSSDVHDNYIKKFTALFPKLTLEDVKSFRFQTRPLVWVEFRNVSLQPGQKTDVQIVMPDKTAPVETHTATDTQLQTEPRGPVLIFEIDPDPSHGGYMPSDVDKMLNVINRRVNPDSKKIARIRIVEQSKIEVAILDKNEAEADRVQRLLERPGTLEFRILANTNDHKSLIDRALNAPDTDVIKDSEGKREAWWAPIWEGQEKKVISISKDIAVREHTVGENKAPEVLVVQDNYNVTSDYLDHAGPIQDPSGRSAVEFRFNSQGGKLFGMFTGDNKPDEVTGFQRRLGIILDGKLHSAPGLKSQIFDRGVIEGSFTNQEVTDLTDVLKSGSLTVRLKLVRKQSVDSEAHKEASKNNLKKLAIAMLMYQDRQKTYPPAVFYKRPDGKTPYSWRVALLLDLGYEELYKQYNLDEPWDSPNNRKLLDKMPEVFRCPADKADSTNASYFALVGPVTMFEKNDTGGFKAGTKMKDVRDGTAHTILLVEAKRDIPWTKPEDIAYDPEKALPELGGFFDDGFHAVFADGSVHFIPKTISENVLRLLINKDERQPVQLPPEAR
jgi:beta-lactamase regulating signal transducer with metallopeptidase domain